MNRSMMPLWLIRLRFWWDQFRNPEDWAAHEIWMQLVGWYENKDFR